MLLSIVSSCNLGLSFHSHFLSCILIVVKWSKRLRSLCGGPCGTWCPREVKKDSISLHDHLRQGNGWKRPVLSGLLNGDIHSSELVKQIVMFIALIFTLWFASSSPLSLILLLVIDFISIWVGSQNNSAFDWPTPTRRTLLPYYDWLYTHSNTNSRVKFVFKFVNFRFHLFTPSLGYFQLWQWK